MAQKDVFAAQREPQVPAGEPVGVGAAAAPVPAMTEASPSQPEPRAGGEWLEGGLAPPFILSPLLRQIQAPGHRRGNLAITDDHFHADLAVGLFAHRPAI